MTPTNPAQIQSQMGTRVSDTEGMRDLRREKIAYILPWLHALKNVDGEMFSTSRFFHSRPQTIPTA